MTQTPEAGPAAEAAEVMGPGLADPAKAEAESEELTALRERLREAERPSHIALRMLLFLLTLGVFVYVMRDSGPLVVAMVVAVLLLHEAGHFVAMRAFGYQNLKVFFVPFLGAAVSGRPAQEHGGWRAGVVSLAGPVPGIVLALLLSPFASLGAPVRVAIVTLVFINGINLLPLLPLDGGRLLNHVIFSRHRALEMFATVVGVIGLVLVPGLLPGEPFMWAGVLAGTLFHRAKMLEARDHLRKTDHGWKGKTSELPGAALLALQSAATRVLATSVASERTRISTVTNLHDEVQAVPAAPAHAAALLLVWAVVGAGAWYAIDEIKHPRARWAPTTVLEGRAQVEFPGPATRSDPPLPPGVKAARVWTSGWGQGRVELIEIVDVAPVDESDPELVQERLQLALDGALALKKVNERSRSTAPRGGRAALDTSFTDAAGTLHFVTYLMAEQTLLVFLTTNLSQDTHERVVTSLKVGP